MLTPADLAAPNLLSGYKHVGFDSTKKAGSKPYHAQIYGGTNNKAGHRFQGPPRATALEAAQDACDFKNTLPPLTIEDIRNPKRKSRFDYVSSSTVGPRSHGGGKPFYAIKRKKAGPVPAEFIGPRRSTAEEAAQDYCDYVNAGRQVVAPAVATLKWPGHPVKTPQGPRPSKPQPVAPKVKVDDDPSGYVYCIGMADNDYAVKIGKSKDHPQYRLAGLQTGTPYLLVLLGYKQVSDRHVAEARHHAHFIQHNILGEWFEKHEDILADFDIKEG